MNKLMKIVKRLCFGIFGIYGVNLLFSAINIYIPINIITVGLSSFLGVFGLMALVLLQFLI